MKTLRLILGDQLNSKHSWFQKADDRYIYVMFEMRQETDYVQHHIQKVIGFFAAMRNFGTELKDSGHQLIYYTINDKRNRQDLGENIRNLVAEHKIEKFEYLLPDEYRLDQQLKEIETSLDIPVASFDNEHFYTARDELSTFFSGKKQYLMESFYRYMRKKHNVLMEGDQPEGGKWNYDKSNRKKWNGKPEIPQPIIFDNDVASVVNDIKNSGIKTIGRFEGDRFDYPINRKQALDQLNYFCKELLPHFGDYQDALHTEEEFLFHSRLSFAMNTKILDPVTVVNKVIKYYYNSKESVGLSQVEGFIRQIIGWREYMRGIYWKEMPGYAQKNALDNHQPLPDFYWTGNTKMNCLSKAINNSLDHAYAHHIQRLMITGNFALLTQVHPDLVDRWYLGIYIDAIEWVEITNTRGMSQYADGGIIATKPYISSSSYINKMGTYCKECSYNRNLRTGDNACPFNSLYWNFLDEKREKLHNNPRMGMMYNLLNKIPGEEMDSIRRRATTIIENPDQF
ncbi:MAG: cryptochrome/photolyase family protein [Flavobacteriaceae bacterium]